MTPTTFTIVGQGLAGSMLARELLQRNQTVRIYDPNPFANASFVSSGIINPITGKRFVKTWNADLFIPFATSFYADLELFFNKKFYHPTPIYKPFQSVRESNDWAIKIGDSAYDRFLSSTPIKLDETFIQNPFGCFEIKGGGWLDTRTLLVSFNQFFKEEEVFFLEKYIPKKEVAENEKVIWCGGFECGNLFSYLPFLPAKGEHLFIETDSFFKHKIINDKVAISPTKEENIFYVGGTYQWDFENNLPSENKKLEILNALNLQLKISYKIVEHRAAIRPTTKDRRPFLGSHPTEKGNFIFNGLGTKGASLTPLLAKNMADFLCNETPIMEEVSIERFA